MGSDGMRVARCMPIVRPTWPRALKRRDAGAAGKNPSAKLTKAHVESWGSGWMIADLAKKTRRWRWRTSPVPRFAVEFLPISSSAQISPVVVPASVIPVSTLELGPSPKSIAELSPLPAETFLGGKVEVPPTAQACPLMFEGSWQSRIACRDQTLSGTERLGIPTGGRLACHTGLGADTKERTEACRPRTGKLEKESSVSGWYTGQGLGTRRSSQKEVVPMPWALRDIAGGVCVLMNPRTLTGETEMLLGHAVRVWSGAGVKWQAANGQTDYVTERLEAKSQVSKSGEMHLDPTCN
ncbi:hypothetical protein P7K49_037591 [Saguinus oedipus]|uniref:Uncharacterized protein n=1 Tax=Saguinus oedipus TaxID=9490 RepID=A0ABQ9TIH3_SAGOE|nr:hypothetical protein P7K49_037591 [Saguinus oedipus]